MKYGMELIDAPPSSGSLNSGDSPVHPDVSAARTGLPFLLLANQAGLLHDSTMASSGVTPDALLPGAASAFATPHWSMGLAARGPDARQAAEALENLCRNFWYPIFAKCAS
jgi:hypothetical protein